MKNKDKFKANFLKYIELCIKNNRLKYQFENDVISGMSNNNISTQFYDYDDNSYKMEFTIYNISDSIILTKDEFNEIDKLLNEYTYSNGIVNQLLDLIKDVEKE